MFGHILGAGLINNDNLNTNLRGIFFDARCPFMKTSLDHTPNLSEMTQSKQLTSSVYHVANPRAFGRGCTMSRKATSVAGRTRCGTGRLTKKTCGWMTSVAKYSYNTVTVPTSCDHKTYAVGHARLASLSVQATPSCDTRTRMATRGKAWNNRARTRK